MDAKTILFYIFAAITVLAALRVITARNPVHSALFLVLSFFTAACIWMLLKAEFLSITLVLVYVGAVMVLFLFVVMMLDLNMDSIRKGFWRHFPLAATIGALVALEMAAVLMGGFRIAEEPRVAAAAAGAAQSVPYSNTKALGQLLYTEYLFPIQVAAAILLVAMFAAIALTLRQRKDTKTVNPAVQVRVRARDRVALVSLAATQQAVAPANEEKQA